MPTVGSLFSGAGGFDVGFDRAGFDVAWQCEIDATARSVLARHWPHTARFPDVREVGKRNLAPVDVVVGGFPCQDLSTAGKRKGFKGERSSLFFEMARVIDELKPSYVVWENVPGLLSMVEEEHNDGRCLCGWDFGWGGMLDGGDYQEDQNVRCEGLSGDDCEGFGGAQGVSRGVRRNAPRKPKGNREVGRGVDVVRDRQSGRPHAQGGDSAPCTQGATGGTVGGTGGNKTHTWRVDRDGQAARDCNSGDRHGVESEGSGAAVAAATRCVVCPGCGRVHDAEAVAGPVRRHAMGAVVREFQRLGYCGAWRVLDAQFFGVPQQRRRVFGVFARRHLGAERPAEILALAESGRRRTPPRRKAGEGVAGTLAPGAHPGGFNGQDAYTGHLVIAGPLTAGIGKGPRGTEMVDGNHQVVAVHPMPYTVHGEHSTAMTGNGLAPVAFPAEVARSLDTTGGYATNQGGTVVACLSPEATPKGRDDGLAFTLQSRQGRGHGHGMAVCVTGERVRHALTGEGHDASEDGTGRGTPIVVAFAENQRGELRLSDVSPAVTIGGGKPGQGYPAALIGPIVRRLTPRECERLMGWPDDHTRYRDTGKEIADGPRYRMCGNGVVGTVAEWIARRLMAAMGEQEIHKAA